MHKGGAVINQRTAQVMRFAGLVMPLILFVYGIFVHYHLVDSSHYVNDVLFFGLMIPWVFLGLLQFLYPATSWKLSGFRFAVYHMLSAIYIIYVSGFANPFIATWVLLFLAAYAYFGKIGLRLSVLSFLLIGELDVLAHLHNNTILLTNILTISAVLLVGLTAVAIARIQEIDGAELSRSKALESLQRDRILTIVNNLADAVLSTDEDGIIRVYNAASLNLLDTNNSLNGHHIDEILKLYESKDKQVSLFELLKNSQSVTVRDDLTMPLEDETLRLEVTFSPIRSSYSRKSGRHPKDGYIVIVRDVTKAKSLEEERDEFISVVSHELRTPITIAEGTISNVQLMMQRPDISEVVLKEAINTAHDQVIYLSKMVNDLSTLSRAERGIADTPEDIDVRALVEDLYNEYAPQAKLHKLHFDLDLDTHLGHVTVSRLYLKELLQNFITNSLKYTKEGSITLAVKRKDNIVSFSVQDTGIGISKSDQTKIFNKFFRSEDYRTRETSGTGLGLYVAAKLARKLNTRISFKSRLNHGSTFNIQLPAADEV